MISRRQFMVASGLGTAGAAGLGGYASAVEPMLRLVVTSYDIAPANWPVDFPLTIAVLADIHAVQPWMPPERIAAIADFTNTLGADIVLLGGDYESRMAETPFASPVAMEDCAEALARLRAPLGVHAVLGNHDVWTNNGDNVRRAFDRHGIPLLENRAVRLMHRGRGFWLLGLADQWVDFIDENIYRGDDDLPGTLAQVSSDEPAILLAHEPDIFSSVPDRISLTISGHTHGGQVRLPFVGPLAVPSRYGLRYAYGHCVEAGRHLVVSGGLGLSILPVRFNAPPEVVLIRLGGAASV